MRSCRKARVECPDQDSFRPWTSGKDKEKEQDLERQREEILTVTTLVFQAPETTIMPEKDVKQDIPWVGDIKSSRTSMCQDQECTIQVLNMREKTSEELELELRRDPIWGRLATLTLGQEITQAADH